MVLARPGTDGGEKTAGSRADKNAALKKAIAAYDKVHKLILFKDPHCEFLK